MYYILKNIFLTIGILFFLVICLIGYYFKPFYFEKTVLSIFLINCIFFWWNKITVPDKKIGFLYNFKNGEIRPIKGMSFKIPFIENLVCLGGSDFFINVKNEYTIKTIKITDEDKNFDATVDFTLVLRNVSAFVKNRILSIDDEDILTYNDFDSFLEIEAQKLSNSFLKLCCTKLHNQLKQYNRDYRKKCIQNIKDDLDNIINDEMNKSRIAPNVDIIKKTNTKKSIKSSKELLVYFKINEFEIKSITSRSPNIELNSTTTTNINDNLPSISNNISIDSNLEIKDILDLTRNLFAYYQKVVLKTENTKTNNLSIENLFNILNCSISQSNKIVKSVHFQKIKDFNKNNMISDL